MTFPTISMEARENNQKMKLNSAARDALYRVGSKVCGKIIWRNEDHTKK